MKDLQRRPYVPLLMTGPTMQALLLPKIIHCRIFPTRSTTDGSSPSVNGDTLAEVDGACSDFEGDGMRRNFRLRQ
jgi:hypothetical protein